MLTAASTEVVGERRLAVVRVAFAGQARPMPTHGMLRDAVFTAPDSVAAYYDTVSYGQLALSGVVTQVLEIDADPDVCRFREWQAAAEELAPTAGIDLHAFDHVAFVFPWSADCQSSALAELGGRHTWYFWGDPDRDVVRAVFTHELGHNFGFNHANSWRCTWPDGEVTQLSDRCDSNEYGDPFDVMGGSYRMGHVSGYFRERAGWLRPDEVRDVDRDLIVRVASINDAMAAGRPRLLRITRPTGNPDDRELLFVEYRTPGAFGDVAGVPGVHVRVAPENATSSVRPHLLDAVPATDSRDDAPLRDRGVLYDTGGLTIRVVRMDPDVAILHVRYGADSQPPRPPSALAAEQQESGRVRLCWEPGHDERALLRHEVERDGERVATLAADARCYEDDAPNVPGVRSYRVVALDLARNESSSEAEQIVVLATPDAPLPDAPVEEVHDETVAVVDATLQATGAFAEGAATWTGEQLP